MKIQVKYFASLKERLGRGEELLELEDGTNVRQLWQQVAGDSSIPSEVMTAINMEYVKPDTVISDGDEVAFFPPVTGG